MGKKIEDSCELLFRQVHPQFFENGIAGARAFKPNSSDAGHMSTDRSVLTNAQSAFDHSTKHLKKQSACVFGLTVGEFGHEKIDCFEDPLPSDGQIPQNPAHSLANYGEHAEKSWKNISQRLKVLAIARGCRYLPA